MVSGPMVSTVSPAKGGAQPLWKRFLVYQAERFPLGAYAPLVLVFTFSAAAYSRLLRGEGGFIPLDRYAVGALTALVFFFLLRVLDEHKDMETDRRYRPELPVPRGLITHAELRMLGGAALVLVLLLNALVAPRLLWACGLVAAWTLLMSREFFVPAWLRVRPTAYLVSHMLVMPLVDAYTTGLDWLAEGAAPRGGLWLFLAVTFLNGTLLEVGRKIRAPEDEREGVDTYSRAWGARGAPVVWAAVLAAAALTACLAAGAAYGGAAASVALAALGGACVVPAWAFRRTPTRRLAKRLDAASGLWTLATYLVLGALPFAGRL